MANTKSKEGEAIRIEVEEEAEVTEVEPTITEESLTRVFMVIMVT